MDWSSFFSGILLGAAAIGALGYYLTPPEFRPALLARAHTKADALRAKISDTIDDLRHKDAPKK